MLKKLLTCFIISSFFVFQADAQNEKPTNTCSTTECHGNLVSQDVIHPAARKKCDNCHQANGQTHPQKDVKGFTLSQEVPNLCYKCHDENNTMANVHMPVKNGKCLDCHTPHSSPESYLLKKYPEGELCLSCHNKLESAQKQHKHEPVVKGECVKCHDPHQSDNNRMLVETSPNLCLKCHNVQAEQMKKPNVHPPFQNNCLNCHAQHSSTEEKLLNLTTKNLCFYCHTDMQKKVEQATTVHGALNDKLSCLNCHNPHASDQKMFLVNNTKDLCLSCHNKTITVGNRHINNIEQTLKKSKSIHGAIDKNGCTGCHDPHATNTHSLLNKEFPVGNYANGNKENFALCFTCHKSDLIEKQTSTVTGFRNGDKNLHFIHLNGEKGRSCTICHNPHGAPNDKLINDSSPFGSWDMPLKFVKSDKGGSCAPGCHTERKYERTTTTMTK